MCFIDIVCNTLVLECPMSALMEIKYIVFYSSIFENTDISFNLKFRLYNNKKT